jgi:hypothetical protein
MGLFDGLLSQVGGNVDVQNLATKVGISPEQAEAAIAALAHAHPQPGDTVETAATTTGLPSDILQQIVGHIGGEGSLAQFASMLHESGGADGILGKISSVFGKS